MANKINKLTKDGVPYDIQDAELASVANNSMLKKNETGAVVAAEAGKDYDKLIVQANAPSSAGDYVGQRFYDSVSKIEYVYTGESSSETYGWVEAGGSGGMELLAEVYSPTSVYAAGVYVLYDDELYKSLVEVAAGTAPTGEETDPNWEKLTVGEALSSLQATSSNIPITSEVPDDADIWIDPDEEDQNESFYTKNETLNDNTKTELGLGANATPNDAFLKLLTSSSGYGSELGNEYVWAKCEATPTYTTTTTRFMLDSKLYVSDSIRIENNLFVLVDPRQVTCSTSADYNALAGKYWLASSEYTEKADTVYRFPVTYDISSEATQYFEKLTNARMELTVVGYVNSSDPNAYPPAVSDGFTYNLLGQLGQCMTKIETGSYVGTGTSGSNNKTSLTFAFTPKFLMIQELDRGVPVGAGGSVSNACGLTALYGQTKVYTSDSSNGNYNGFVTLTWNGNSVSWYTTFSGNMDVPGVQMNTSGSTYLYFAIG